VVRGRGPLMGGAGHRAGRRGDRPGAGRGPVPVPGAGGAWRAIANRCPWPERPGWRGGGRGLAPGCGQGAGRRPVPAHGGGVQGQGDEGGAGGQGDGAAHDHQDGPQRQSGRWHCRWRGWRSGRRFGWRGGRRGGRGHAGYGGQRQQQSGEGGQGPAGGGPPPGVVGTGAGGQVGHVRSLLACWGPGGPGAVSPPIGPMGSTARGGRNAGGRGVEAGLESAWSGGGIGGNPPWGVRCVAVTWVVRDGR
jgi:hypothetical protein